MLRTSLMVSCTKSVHVTGLTNVLESREPGFLRKLKSEYGGGNSARHERPLARPRKAKIDENDDEEPTYVDEESHDTLSRQQYEAMLQSKDGMIKKGDTATDPGVIDEESTVPSKTTTSSLGEVAPPKMELVAAIGTTGKRRIGKVVGESVAADETRVGETTPVGPKKPAKKAKKIKLSFDDY